jgi:ubiquinone/menaquinone biosynthesis C-methylase UbiE
MRYDDHDFRVRGASQAGTQRQEDGTMPYDKQQATHEFNRWSRSYDRSILQRLLFGPSHRALIHRISEHAVESRSDRPLQILDIGCGTGVFAARIREAFPTSVVYGMDLVSDMLTKGKERWREHASHVVPVQGDSERLPFASSSFDVVTCANSFHHYPDQSQAVREMYRVLRPSGRLLLIDGYRDAPWGWFIYDVCVESVEGNVHHCSRQRMRELFRAAGFEGMEQKIHRGAAPFLLNQAFRPLHAVPAPHFGQAGVRSGLKIA